MTERIGAHLRDLPLEDMREMLIARGEPEYRFRQLCQWLYGKLACGFDEMTDLPKPLRVSLAASFHVENARPALSQVSQLDGTRKHLFELNDGNFIEAVLMRYEKRTTLCISTQVGCPLDCVFCETAKGRFRRNLTAGEMLDQICVLRREGGVEDKKVNVVFMGMGEPLLNLAHVSRALELLAETVSPRRTTVSTAGIVPGLERLAALPRRPNLAVSLNATTQQQRERLMPVASRWTLDELIAALHRYPLERGRRITVEYVLLAGINDSDEDARRLPRLLRGLPVKVNLIPFNPDPLFLAGFAAPDEPRIDAFAAAVAAAQVNVTVRWSKGREVAAACGQLRGRVTHPAAGAAGAPSRTGA